VIVASPADYQNLLKVIKQLDKRRRQVFVEAMIVEASIDRLREIGAKWRLIGERDNAPIAIGGFGTMSASDLQSLIYGLTGLSFGGMGDFTNIKISLLNADGSVTQSSLDIPRFAALFSLDEFRGAVNVLSTPHILTSDNEEAEIVVGENVPFITRRESDPTRTLSVFSSIERKDVGITLRITPHITKGEYVKLDIYQEISSVKQESENILISLGPTTTKRSTKTSVVVKNNQTVVIGGLMQKKEERNVHKLPLLGDIPLLKYLFRYESRVRKKTNLLVFLTPRVVKDSEHLSEITEEKKAAFGRSENRYIKGELILKFKKDVSTQKALEILDKYQLKLINYNPRSGKYYVRLEPGQKIKVIMPQLLALPEVEYVEPHYTIRENL